MQTFRPEEHDLVTNGDALGASGLGGSSDGGPVMRGMMVTESGDRSLFSGLWESEAGTQAFCHGNDEWVYILEGEAHVQVGSNTTVLRAGAAAFFPAGLEMTWTIPDYVRKVWVQRRLPLHQRIPRKLRRMAASTSTPQRAAVAAGVALAGGGTATGVVLAFT